MSTDAHTYKPYVTCTMRGGLGNQLFIITATLAYAQEHGIQCIFPAAYQGMPRIDGGWMPVYWHSLLRALQPCLRDPLPSAPVCEHVLREAEHEFFAPTSLPPPPPGCGAVRLDGYFQHLDHASAHWDHVMQALGVREQQGEQRHADAIALHFRLGDYEHLRHLYPAMTIDYYARALAHVVRATGRPDWPVHYALPARDALMSAVLPPWSWFTAVPRDRMRATSSAASGRELPAMLTRSETSAI